MTTWGVNEHWMVLVESDHDHARNATRQGVDDGLDGRHGDWLHEAYPSSDWIEGVHGCDKLKQ